ncbi:MAG: hypothetical protein HC849_29205 [Oscillatoriales cyanobacterium RU_3_3]|nr:hypothetical protein [Microcoleus sp. SU_5_6]NJL65814.1 hypothetical protein [Microcoleus sp. SM1_3_4]NJM63326.1 hypothetical protein [Oscillatoriales cyanobacterium RU_3_3]
MGISFYAIPIDCTALRRQKEELRVVNCIPCRNIQDWMAQFIRSNEVKVNKNTSDSRSKSASTSCGVLKIGINGMNPTRGTDRTSKSGHN